MTGTGTATERFVRWAWSLQPGDIPDDVHRAMRRLLLDGWGCALAAARLDAARPAVTVATRATAPSEATVPGLDVRLPAGAAALATGALVHALDYDDTHAAALVHTTAAVLPALSAVGQRVGADPDALAVAAVAGYELVIRLGAAVPHGFHARGLHATSVCGVFAATAVAARLLGLDAGQAVHALGIAGSQAAGSLEFLDAGTDTKSLHPGLAAQAGVLAADLAGAGATGPATILEGRHGLFASYLGQVPADDLVAGLGKHWRLTETEVKAYPCCHLSHATLDAIRSCGVPGSDVASVVVQLPAAAVDVVAEPRPHKVAPRSSYDAKFSLPWSVAALLLDGELTVDTFGDVARADVRDLAARVSVVGVPHDAPPATVPGRVEVTTYAGYSVEATAPAGRRLDDDAVVAKFVANAGTGDAAEGFARTVLDKGWGNA